jgi:hopanoid C-3 methylase
MLWKFNKVYNVDRQLADHRREVRYEMSLPRSVPQERLERKSLYIYRPEPTRAA